MAVPQLLTKDISDNDRMPKIVTHTLTRFFNQLNNVEAAPQNIINNIRHIEINEYSILKYKKQTLLLQKIIVICVIALIGSLFFYSNIIPNTVYNIYLGIIFGVGFIIVMYDLFDIFIRTDYDFNQFDYNFIYTPPTINNKDKNYNTLQLSNLPTVCK
jgi:hypothetical protein